MRQLRAAVLISLSAVTVSGCWSHSFPAVESFIRPVEQQTSLAETVQVFADPNGTFYPTGWTSHMGRPRSWKADSLLNESNDDPAFRKLIEDGERQQLAELAAFAAPRKRIFVLIHGYNNTMKEAEGAYRLIEQRLGARSDDGIIRFYWDGLSGKGVGGGKIWFNASGYSQLVGSRGLRRVLSTFSGKQVYLIGHSRGASVILSALGDPVYHPGFLSDTKKVAATWGSTYSDFLKPAALPASGNKISILALAPAVDRIDFCDASQQPVRPGRYTCRTYRDLGEVTSFRYTVNARDPVLNKFIGLSAGFNPTGLGLRDEVGETLARRYGFMTPYRFSAPEKFHRFSLYVEHPSFSAMLSDAGIAKP